MGSTGRIPIFPVGGFISDGVRLALLALSVVFVFAQAVVDNANNTSLIRAALHSETKIKQT